MMMMVVVVMMVMMMVMVMVMMGDGGEGGGHVGVAREGAGKARSEVEEQTGRVSLSDPAGTASARRIYIVTGNPQYSRTALSTFPQSRIPISQRFALVFLISQSSSQAPIARASDCPCRTHTKCRGNSFSAADCCGLVP